MCKHQHLACLACIHHDNSEHPTIEVIKTVEGVEKTGIYTSNEIVFILEGRLEFGFRDFASYEAAKGQVLFIPVGTRCTCRASTNGMLVVFRIHNPAVLCENYPVEKLYKIKGINPADGYTPKTKQFGSLEINARMWRFLDGLTDNISDGLRCRCWFEMKIKEFFLFLRVYYPKENIHDFLFVILSRDVAFSEYVRRNWRKFPSVAAMADSLHMTAKYFSLRFTSVFGKPPSRWIKEGKARIVHREIASTKKQFKQIAMENGFSSDALFTRFCKRELGKTPTEIRKIAGKKFADVEKGLRK